MNNRPKIVFISGKTDSVSHRFRVTHTADALEKTGYRTEQYDLNDITDRFSLRECEMLVIFRAEWNLHLESDNPFCESKSALRCIMAGTVETPSIVSPTQPLLEATGDGKYGLVARNDEEWYPCIRTLISNVVLRKKFGTESNAYILQNFGPESGASLSRLVFKDIIRDHRSRKSGLLTRIFRGII